MTLIDQNSAMQAALAVPANQSVREILHPRNVAIVGASASEDKWGGRLLRYMLKHHHDGALYPINARASELMGVPAYASLRDCPGPVDLAILLVPKGNVKEAIEDCVAMKVGCALCITAGFAETGPAGRAVEDDLVVTARAGGVRLIGPNCMGLLNTHHQLAATTGVVLGTIDRLPTGGIGLASQSGALMGAMLSRGVDIGAGFSSMVSVGNQADLDLNDFFEYLIDDPETTVVCLYMEAVKDASRFVSLLARAAERGKPVCICKSGRSEAGVRAAISHTASVAGAWPAFEATCRRWGVYLFESIYDLVQGAQLLNNGKQASGCGAAVFSGSGGGGALLADALESHGLELPMLSSQTTERLASVLPATHRQLPHDFGMLNHLSEPDPDVAGGAVGIALDRAMADDAVGLGLLLLTTQPQQERVVEAALAAAARTSKPLLFVQGAGNHGNVARKALRAAGYGYFDSQHDALKVAEVMAHRSVPEPLGPPPVKLHFPTSLPAGYLGEPQTRALLEQSGIATTPWKLAVDTKAAVIAARSLGGPVVIKAVSDAIVHKSDIGAVKLNLQGDAAVRAACGSIMAAAGKAGVPSLDGFLVTRMCEADSELILGLQHDPDFGPLVMIGAGGVLIELLNDVQLAPAPLSRATALAMLASLKSRVLLDGYRGRAPADLEQIADAMVRLGALAVASQGRLRELDINPLFVVNGKIVAADARAVLA